MLFSLVVALMVILVTVFWVYQGLFSALLMFFLSVVSCMLAFEFHEQVQALWEGTIDPSVGLPLALMLIFLICLALLRVLTDKLIPDNVRLPVYADRAGGGVFGFFVGLILVGISLTAIQMLPLGSTVFGFERVKATADGRTELSNFWFKPDNFTVGLATMLSNGRFGGDNPLSRSKPDLLLELYSARANPQPEERLFLPQDSLQVLGYWEARQIDEVTQRADGDALAREFQAVEPSSPGSKFLVFRVRVNSTAAKSGAEIRFRPLQFRLVGPPPSIEGMASRDASVYFACGMTDLYTHKGHGLRKVSAQQATRLVKFGPQTNLILGPEVTRSVGISQGGDSGDFVAGYRFDVAFEVPEDFQPWFMEFKRGARVEITKQMFKEEPPADASVSGGRDLPKGRGAEGERKKSDSASVGDDKPKVKVGDAPGGAVHVADAIAARTGVFSELPFPLDANDPVVRGALVSQRLGECHFFVEIPDPPPTDWEVTEFNVPGGKRMVQVGAEKKDALSLFGRALNYATNVAAQIRLTDENGNDYYAIGVYSAAPVNGKMVLEVQYHPEADVPERCLARAKKITANMLRDTPPDQRRFGYLFLVDPGVKIVKFNAGARQGASQELIIDVP